MVDKIDKETRSRVMASIHSKDTKIELYVRSIVHRIGYRFRLYRKDLPGSPDLTFPARRKAMFVHGCFWHRHDCSTGRKVPASNEGYWIPKLARNKERDVRTQQELRELGWDVLVIWECEAGDPDAIVKKVISFLGGK
jgi:DNA mismatch endonuclease (patch repair protein)